MPPPGKPPARGVTRPVLPEHLVQLLRQLDVLRDERFRGEVAMRHLPYGAVLLRWVHGPTGMAGRALRGTGGELVCRAVMRLPAVGRTGCRSVVRPALRRGSPTTSGRRGEASGRGLVVPTPPGRGGEGERDGTRLGRCRAAADRAGHRPGRGRGADRSPPGSGVRRAATRAEWTESRLMTSYPKRWS